MKDLLKLIICGSVDDGKSTLIGHIMYDAKKLHIDQVRELEYESKVRNREGRIDYSLLTDGLLEEQEQGITIDVSYKFFNTESKSYIVADTPGHEQYTRNMAVGASFADVAILLLDVTKGLMEQTIRHMKICYMFGIKYIFFAVNKMDLVEYQFEKFEFIQKKIKQLVRDYDFTVVKILPISATEGDNLVDKSENMIWYQGESLLSYLDKLNIVRERANTAFFMPIQRVCRPDSQFRGFQGQIESGQINLNDRLEILPSKEKARIKRIICGMRDVYQAEEGQAITIVLDKEVDISRGDVLKKEYNCKVSNSFTVQLLWMDDLELCEGKSYYIKIGTKLIIANIVSILHKANINSENKGKANKIKKNEMAVCEISTLQEIVIDNFSRTKTLGSFILIDRISHNTVACGIVINIHGNNDNVHEKSKVISNMRAGQKKQRPVTIWFTGLSGAGKTTLAQEVEKRLFYDGMHTMFLDGDEVRAGINKDLGFTQEDRTENIRRVAEVARLMNEAGLIVLASLISPKETDRKLAKEIIGDGFVEVYVSTNISVCRARDVKGLYKKAEAGKISGFTGISAPYEPPKKPFLEIDTSKYDVQQAADIVVNAIYEFLEE